MDMNAVIARINELAAKNKTVGLTEEELEENSRSKSAKLRIFERS